MLVLVAELFDYVVLFTCTPTHGWRDSRLSTYRHVWQTVFHPNFAPTQLQHRPKSVSAMALCCVCDILPRIPWEYLCFYAPAIV